MFSISYIKLMSLVLFCVTTLSFSQSKSLNVFELGLVGTGVALVFNQYYDNSLSEKNTFQQKSDVISKYTYSKKLYVSGSQFKNLPLQQQMIILESSKDH